MRHIILLSGKDSLATAIVQTRRRPDLTYEFVHNEVGWDLPETLEWIRHIETVMGWSVTRCGDDLTEICFEQNCLPLAGVRRFCTKYAKVRPLNDYLGRCQATLYFGLRADEADRAGYSPPKYQTPVYPLREEGINLDGVWKICTEAGLLPPQFYWPWMEDRVRQLLGGKENLLQSLKPWEHAMLFAWRSRSNCDRCPYQRQYEWVGLHEFHPELFADAMSLETKLCHRDEHTWISGYRLHQILERAEEIKDRRARRIVRFLHNRSQRILFEDEYFVDDLQATSCGLLCGK